MKKSTTKSKASNTKPNQEINKKLVENFVALQKVITNLSIKFDNLSDQIAKLLELFEISAKAMAEKDYEQFSTSEDKKVLEKIDMILEQNKTIAKGVSMLHEGNKEQEIQTPTQQYPPKMNYNRQPPRQLLPSEHSRLQRKNPQNYY